MSRFFLAVFLATCFTSLQHVDAQAPLAHQHTPTNVIDGAVHPELIPDSVAYRLYFIAISNGPNPTDDEVKRQSGHLKKIGLKDIDRETLRGALTEFRTQYEALVRQYNEAATAAQSRNEMADINGFLRSLDGLVQAARDNLNLRLTAEGMTQLHSFVQMEKRNMQVDAGEK